MATYPGAFASLSKLLDICTFRSTHLFYWSFTESFVHCLCTWIHCTLSVVLLITYQKGADYKGTLW